MSRDSVDKLVSHQARQTTSAADLGNRLQLVAQARAQIRPLVDAATEGRQFGILGEARVNVLKLNLLLEGGRDWGLGTGDWELGIGDLVQDLKSPNR